MKVDKRRRGVIASERNTTPPMAASTGTDSCTMAARVVVSPRNAVYQTAYPTPDVSVPDRNARSAPFDETEVLGHITRLNPTANGTERTKFPVVTLTGSTLPRPRNEYSPQEMPAAAMSADPMDDGADNPGSSR
jgi:hypothetical protein